ncbi:MAG: hypothetical protein E7211_20100 [Clostridium lundense]|nr:hypothetical protein [Clostridium lundense]
MSETENLEQITADDVYEVLKFANYLYGQNPYGGYFTPNMSNQNLIDLNNNPLVPSVERVEKALANYKVSGEELKGYAEFMEVFDILYKRVVGYYSGMLRYDLDIECTNAFTKEDYNSEQYKDDLKRVYKFLDKFDYKEEFAKVTKQLLRHEVDYTWLRDSKGTFNDDPENPTEVNVKKSPKYTLQEMPQSYCKITGKWEYGMLYDFDVNYFTKGGVSVLGFDPSLIKQWNKIREGKRQEYNPTSQLNVHDGSFANWTQVSPYNGAWVFKMDMTNVAIVPFFASIIPKVLDAEEVGKLQKNKDIIGARALLVGEIQLLDKQKSGNATDALAYNPKTLMKFLKLVKNGLNESINAVAMPTKDPKMYQFKDENTDMVNNNLKTSVGQFASGSRLLFVNDKMSETEAKCAIITDYNLVEPLYRQYENFLNYYVNRKTSKYKFKFTFSGSTYYFVNEKRDEKLVELMDKGVVFAPRTYAKLVDMKPQQFDRLLTEGNATDWTIKLTSLMQNVYTQSGNPNDKGGRPQSSDSDLSDSGSTAREYK